MSVPATISPETGPQQQRSHIRRCLTAAVASAIIAAAAIAIATGDDPDESRPPKGNPPSTGGTGANYPNYPHDYWRFNDPRVVKGAGGAPIR